ncbi:hypothetical protein IW145_002875 [Coemansia sp. RSA 521]|nr:hypothetical protein J3F82_003703 [Coemansia sp. RSA 637]KAJ2205312.1 hypothetical protein IW145_002875 [Coemansia sp. RSA 521]
MKLGFATLLLAFSSAFAQPIASSDNHLEARASVKINYAKLKQAINTDNRAIAEQRNAINQINKAMSNLGSMSGSSITAARRAHQNAINAQKKAMAATQAAMNGLKRMLG